MATIKNSNTQPKLWDTRLKCVYRKGLVSYEKQFKTEMGNFWKTSIFELKLKGYIPTSQ